MSKYAYAEAQMALDVDRDNVEVTAQQLRGYCQALRERIRRYYGCMDTAEKQQAMVVQREKCAELMDVCDDFLSYMQDGDNPDGPWAQISHAPMSAAELAAQEAQWAKNAMARADLESEKPEKSPAPAFPGHYSEENSIRKTMRLDENAEA